MLNRREFVAAAATTMAASAIPTTLRGAPPRGRVGRIDPSKLQALLDQAAKELGVVGAQLALYDGESITEVATGLADLERRRPVTTDTLFHLLDTNGDGFIDQKEATDYARKAKGRNLP